MKGLNEVTRPMDKVVAILKNKHLINQRNMFFIEISNKWLIS